MKHSPIGAQSFIVIVFAIAIGIPLLLLAGWGVWEMTQWVNSLPHG